MKPLDALKDDDGRVKQVKRSFMDPKPDVWWFLIDEVFYYRKIKQIVYFSPRPTQLKMQGPYEADMCRIMHSLYVCITISESREKYEKENSTPTHPL